VRCEPQPSDRGSERDTLMFHWRRLGAIGYRQRQNGGGHSALPKLPGRNLPRKSVAGPTEFRSAYLSVILCNSCYNNEMSQACRSHLMAQFEQPLCPLPCESGVTRGSI